MTILYFIEAKDPRLVAAPHVSGMTFLNTLQQHQGTAFLGDFDEDQGLILGSHLSATGKPRIRLPRNSFEGFLFLSHLDEITGAVFKALVEPEQGFNLIVSLQGDQGDVFGYLFRFKEGHALVTELLPIENLILNQYLFALLKPEKLIVFLSSRQQQELELFFTTTEWQAFRQSLQPEQIKSLSLAFQGVSSGEEEKGLDLHLQQWVALRAVLLTEAGFNFRNGLTPLEGFFFKHILRTLPWYISVEQMSLEQGLLRFEEIPFALLPEAADIQMLEAFTPRQLFSFYLTKPDSPLNQILAMNKGKLILAPQTELLAVIYTLFDGCLLLYLFLLSQEIDAAAAPASPAAAAAAVAIALGAVISEKELEA